MTKYVKRLLVWVMFDCFLVGSAWTRTLFSYLDYMHGSGELWLPVVFALLGVLLLISVVLQYHNLIELGGK